MRLDGAFINAKKKDFEINQIPLFTEFPMLRPNEWVPSGGDVS